MKSKILMKKKTSPGLDDYEMRFILLILVRKKRHLFSMKYNTTYNKY